MWWTCRQRVSMILTIYAVGLVLFILFHWESVLCGTVHIDFLPFHNVHPMSLVSSYCLSNFSLFITLFATSMASLKLFIGNNIQYNLLGNVFFE